MKKALIFTIILVSLVYARAYSADDSDMTQASNPLDLNNAADMNNAVQAESVVGINKITDTDNMAGANNATDIANITAADSAEPASNITAAASEITAVDNVTAVSNTTAVDNVTAANNVTAAEKEKSKLQKINLKVIDAQNMQYDRTPLNKLTRGLTNTLTCYCELPASMFRIGVEKGPFLGFFMGTANGIVTTIFRLATGIYDTVTFLFSPYGKPLMTPEYASESLRDAYNTYATVDDAPLR